MPELPEVETVRRGLALRMSGRQIVRAELRRPDLRRPFPPDLAERLHGARIGELFPARQVHPGRTRRQRHSAAASRHVRPDRRRRGRRCRPEKRDHVVLTAGRRHRGALQRCPPLRRRSTISCAAGRWGASAAGGARPRAAGSGLRRRLSEAEALSPASLTPIKSALLDQKIVAGLRNIYVCEALYRAGISPRRLAATVVGARAGGGSWAAVREVLERGDRRRRLVAARLCAGQRRTRLFPAPLGGLRQGGRALPRLHLRRRGAPHHPSRPLDLLLQQSGSGKLSQAVGAWNWACSPIS